MRRELQPDATAIGLAALGLGATAAAGLGAPSALWIGMIVVAVFLGAWGVTLARKRQVAVSPLQRGLACHRAQAAELRSRLRRLPEDEEWRQREYVQAMSDQIKDDWVSSLYKLFSDVGALELRNEFMRINGPSGEAMYEREPLIRFLDDAMALLRQMQKRLVRPAVRPVGALSWLQHAKH